MIFYEVDADDVELLEDGNYQVQMWKEDVFREIDDFDLEEECNKRNLVVGSSDNDDEVAIDVNNFVLPKTFNKTQLRDHLVSFAGLGTHASDSEILEQLRWLMYF